jgi:hypothetical protein
MLRGALIVCVMAVSAASSAHGQARRDAAARCEALSTSLHVPGLALEITTAQWHAAGDAPPSGPGPAAPAGKLPAHCRVDGVLDRRTGSDGRPYAIGFALALPAEWNGRFLMQGGGGLNGRVAPPLGAQAAGDTPALVRGFAVVSTDTGHQGAVFDATFMREQQAALDFAYVAIGRVALLARQIIAAYYGKPPDHSYFAGCSTGGREGMVMAQRYPGYFDGIVSGAPAMRTGHSNLALRSMVTAFNRLAPREPTAKAGAGRAFSDADRKVVLDALLAACDAGDGLEDGMIFNSRSCRFDPSSLACAGPSADGCLSAEQAAAIARAFGGPTDSAGRAVYVPFPYDTGITAAGAGIPGILGPGAGPPVPPAAGTEQDVDREARLADRDPQAILTDTWSWTNLSTFSSRGGKLIFYHGVSDPWFSALDTVDYYERLAANGGPGELRDWSRLFLLPGVGHCGGGRMGLDSVDFLSAIVKWVEDGAAPDALRATGRALPGRSQPICAWPRYAHYKGSGDPDDAASFECRP